MIVSHRHRFVFLRPRKVAGTSIEVAMSRHCGGNDIITPIGRHQARWDDDAWTDLGQDGSGYRRHPTVEQVRSKLGNELWDQYLKFSVVRNPWDLVVSQYHWATRRGAIGRSAWNTVKAFWLEPKRFQSNVQTVWANAAQRVYGSEPVPFDFFATHLLRFYGDNGDQYFDRSGALALDFVIRFENLASDYEVVCERLGLPGGGPPRSSRRPGPTGSLIRPTTPRRHGRVWPMRIGSTSTSSATRSRRAERRSTLRQVEFGYTGENG